MRKRLAGGDRGIEKGWTIGTLQQKADKKYCLNCGNLIIKATCYGCTARDKLIMPEYLTYSGRDNSGIVCKDWVVYEQVQK